MLSQKLLTDLSIGGGCLTAGGVGVWIFHHIKKVRARGRLQILIGEEEAAAAKEAQERLVPALCPAHDGLVKLLDERNVTIKEEFSDVKATLATINVSLGTIHRRIDDFLKR